MRTAAAKDMNEPQVSCVCKDVRNTRCLFVCVSRMDLVVNIVAWASNSKMLEDPVFLTIFALLGYRKLFSRQSETPTIISIVLIVLVAFSMSRLVHTAAQHIDSEASFLRPADTPSPPPPPTTSTVHTPNDPPLPPSEASNKNHTDIKQTFIELFIRVGEALGLGLGW